MTVRKKVVTQPSPSSAPPPGSLEEKPVIQQEEKSPEFENALDELLNLYPPGSEGIECRVYKILESKKKGFMLKLDYFPDESDIKEKCGPGEYYLYCYVFVNGRRKLLKTPTINILDTVQPSSSVNIKSTDNSVSGILDQLQAFRNAGLIQQPNSNSESNLTPIMNMMIENNKSNMLLLLKMLENSNKPAPSTNDAIMQVLLTKALDKSDPMKEINTILKIKDSLASDAAPADGGDFMSIIGKSLPFILQMAANSGGAAPAKVPNPGTPQLQAPKINPAVAQAKLKKELISLLKDDLKEIVIDAIHTYNTESESTEPPLQTEDEFGAVSEIEEPENVHELISEANEENNSPNNFDMNNMNLENIAAQIKLLPEDQKIKTLQYWLENAPLENVKAFLLEHKVAETELEFWQYVKKCGHEELIPEGIIV